MSSFPHLAVCLKGCVSERLSVSWKDCLSLWRTVCLVKGLSVFWKDSLSGELSVSRENFLSLGRTVCLFVQRISSLSERLFLWRTLCLSLRLLEGFSVYPKNCLPLWRTVCLSLYLRRLSVFTVFFCLSIHLSLPVCLSIVLSSSVCLY